MKKMLLFVACVAVFAGCKKEEVKDTQTLFVNVSYQYPDDLSMGKKIANPSLVQLYDYDAAKAFDVSKSVSSITNNYSLSLPDGSTVRPKYESTSYVGINTFNDIPNGKYMLVVYFKPEGYSWTMFYYYGYKEIIVNGNDIAIQTYEIVFNWGTDSGKFVRK